MGYLGSTKKTVRVLVPVHAPSFTLSVCMCVFDPVGFIQVALMIPDEIVYLREHGELTCGYISEECIHASSVTINYL